MNFQYICPKCKKTYTNGGFTTCGTCRVELLPIKLNHIQFDDFNKKVTIVYDYIEDASSTKNETENKQ